MQWMGLGCGNVPVLLGKEGLGWGLVLSLHARLPGGCEAAWEDVSDISSMTQSHPVVRCVPKAPSPAQGCWGTCHCLAWGLAVFGEAGQLFTCTGANNREFSLRSGVAGCSQPGTPLFTCVLTFSFIFFSLGG